MSVSKLPLILDPEELAPQLFKKTRLSRQKLLIVDLSSAATHAAYHVPGAVHLEYAKITEEQPLAAGPLADSLVLTQALSAIGLTAKHHVVVYDEGDNAQACRFLWTLDLLGHTRYSLLNGGLSAWLDARLPIENEVQPQKPSKNKFEYQADAPSAGLLYILQHLQDDNTVFIDCRSPEEYRGEDMRALRGGHIPGAINLDYRLLLDREHNQSLRPEPGLRSVIEAAGIDLEKELICYCHSHRRSALVYIALKALGCQKLKAYPGSWAEWGNNLDTPIE